MDGAMSSESVLLDAGTEPVGDRKVALLLEPESVDDRKVALLLEAGAAGSGLTLQPMRRSNDITVPSGMSSSSSDCDELSS
jgi:hypothetical protein